MRIGEEQVRHASAVPMGLLSLRRGQRQLVAVAGQRTAVLQVAHRGLAPRDKDARAAGKLHTLQAAEHAAEQAKGDAMAGVECGSNGGLLANAAHTSLQLHLIGGL